MSKESVEGEKNVTGINEVADIRTWRKTMMTCKLITRLKRMEDEMNFKHQ